MKRNDTTYTQLLIEENEFTSQSIEDENGISELIQNSFDDQVLERVKNYASDVGRKSDFKLNLWTRPTV